MNYTKEIILDFNAESIHKTIKAKQNDIDARFLIINPTLDGNEFDMDGITAVFCAEKPDGKNIINHCIIDEGKIFVELTSQTLAISGIIRCEIKLYKDQSVLSSCPFFIDVIRSLDDNGIESSDEFTILAELIKECKEFMKYAKTNLEKPYIFNANINQVEVIEKNYEEAIE